MTCSAGSRGKPHFRPNKHIRMSFKGKVRDLLKSSTHWCRGRIAPIRADLMKRGARIGEDFIVLTGKNSVASGDLCNALRGMR
jgi:hypothetical protein